MALSQRLKQARLEAGLSQKALCGDRITRNMLSQIENGSARPSMDTLRYLAQQLGKPAMSAQAVGAAVGRNPVSIIIPCHRVVGADGNLTGYAGGVERKLQLLQLEGADLSRLHVPKKS